MSRKRLGRIDPKAVEEAHGQTGARALRTKAPIAQMAAGVGRSIEGEIQRLRAQNASLAEKGALYDTAETEGRVIRLLPLDAIDPTHIPRDRRALDRAGEDWDALKLSLASRGQQVPIEVVDLGPEAKQRYGLITGLRRLTALVELYDESGSARFAKVQALIRPITTEPEKLIAMVEENEIRAGLSFYERGRIVALATESGLFADTDTAISELFAASNRNRRYKIRCFVTVYLTLEGRLRFPDAIGERLGIALAKAIRAGQGHTLQKVLTDWNESLAQPLTEEQELCLLSDFASGRGLFAAEPAKGRRSPETISNPESRTLTATWQGTEGRRVSAYLEDDTVRVEIDGLSGVDQEGLGLLVSWLGERMEAG